MQIVISEPTEITEPLVINEPSVLTCINGAYLKLLTYGDTIPAVLCNASCTFFNFNIRAGGKALTDNKESDGLQCGVKTNNPESVVQYIGGEMIGFNYAGFWAFDTKLAIMSGVKIVGSGVEKYYNYGAWQGGRGNAKRQDLYFVNNKVSGVRHAVGASYHPNSYYASCNQVDSIKHAFDRHSENGYGGFNTHIIGNTINPDRYLFSVNEPYGTVLTFGNTSRGSKPLGEVSGNPVHLGYETRTINIR